MGHSEPLGKMVTTSKPLSSVLGLLRNSLASGQKLKAVARSHQLTVFPAVAKQNSFMKGDPSGPSHGCLGKFCKEWDSSSRAAIATVKNPPFFSPGFTFIK